MPVRARGTVTEGAGRRTTKRKDRLSRPASRRTIVHGRARISVGLDAIGGIASVAAILIGVFLIVLLGDRVRGEAGAEGVPSAVAAAPSAIPTSNRRPSSPALAATSTIPPPDADLDSSAHGGDDDAQPSGDGAAAQADRRSAARGDASLPPGVRPDRRDDRERRGYDPGRARGDPGDVRLRAVRPRRDAGVYRSPSPSRSRRTGRAGRPCIGYSRWATPATGELDRGRPELRQRRVDRVGRLPPPW